MKKTKNKQISFLQSEKEIRKFLTLVKDQNSEIKRLNREILRLKDTYECKAYEILDKEVDRLRKRLIAHGLRTVDTDPTRITENFPGN